MKQRNSMPRTDRPGPLSSCGPGAPLRKEYSRTGHASGAAKRYQLVADEASSNGFVSSRSCPPNGFTSDAPVGFKTDKYCSASVSRLAGASKNFGVAEI